MEIVEKKPIMIFRKDGGYGPMYSLAIPNKLENGTYQNGYINVRFRKGVNIADRTKIKIQKSWLGCNVKNKVTYPYIFIDEFTYDDVLDNFPPITNSVNKTDNEILKEVMESDDPFASFANEANLADLGVNEINITADDLPF